MMEHLFITKILCLPIAILAPAFFASAETALTSLSSINLNRLKGSHPHRKAFFEFWETYPDKVLTSIILANTLATVVSGILAASIGKDCEALFGLPSTWMIPSISLVVAVFVLIFGETLPKIFGRHYSEGIAKLAVIPLVLLTKLIHPLVQLLVQIASLFVKVFGVETQGEIPKLNVAELKGMLESEGPGETATSPQRILKNILEFGRLRVKDVQNPREKIFAIDLNKTPREVMSMVWQSPYSRIPVYKQSLDNITGIIYAKDLLNAWRTEGLILIPDLLRPVYFVSEQTSVSELLREFKKGHHHFAMVRDEAKKITGIITIEDVLEEIVGEIHDESKLQ